MSTLRRDLTNAPYVLQTHSQTEVESWWTVASINGQMLYNLRQIFKLRHLSSQTATNSIVNYLVSHFIIGFTWIEEGCTPCGSSADGSTF
jgi:hypothetical protein